MRGLHAARAALLMAAGLMACGQAAAGEIFGQGGELGTVSRGTTLSEFEEAKMPSGLASLCLRQPELCAAVQPPPQPLQLSNAQWALVASVNRSVNRSIASTTDEKLYGRLEYWTLPGTAGDCEDYVLLKRKTLAALGIPLASLLITVVQDENGEGHAVLSIPTPQGDVVLDNRRDDILHWTATGYGFVKRQSAANPNMWVSLGHERLQATNIASGPEATPSE